MADIKLPALPLIPLFMDASCRDEIDSIIRTRDIEIARVVLGGVADWIRTQRTVTPANGFEFASSIRALEFTHD